MNRPHPEKSERPSRLRRRLVTLYQAAAGETKVCEDEARSSRLLRAVCYVRRLSDAYAVHQCGLMASACAFSAIFSLIPLLAVGVAVLGFLVGGSERALHEVTVAIQGYVPLKADLIHDTLSHVLADRRLIGLFGLLGLLFTAHQMFMAMMPAMNIIWNAPEKRHWFRQRLIALGATCYTLILLGADLGVTALLAYLLGRQKRIISQAEAEVAWRLLLALLPMLLTTLLFTLLYRLLPARETPYKAALIGGVVAAALWQLTKLGFTLFLSYSHGYVRLYGSISSLAILFVWVYYSMAILLLGAEIAADYNARIERGLLGAEARARTEANLTLARGTTPMHHHANPAETTAEDRPEPDSK